jgi:uroporphyrinogen decarboxylase
LRTMNTSFLDACNRKDPEFTPVWFMRQAGRYLSSYRQIKGGRGIIEMAKSPELASEAAVDAVRVLGVDAGIIFADIMLPLEALGVEFRIQENVGPVVSNPIRSLDDVDALETLEPDDDMAYLCEGITATIEKLDGAVPLIGFSGAPFTLAGYMIEGGPSRNLEKTKTMMYSKPEVWESLMRKLTKMVTDYLNAQIRYGVQAVQLFDSWVGCLSPGDYEKFVLPHTKEIFSSTAGVARIHFCADSASLIEGFHRTGADVLSVDWRIPIDDVWSRCSEETAVQGNLDPVAALAGGGEMKVRVYDILKGAQGHKGHVFSLGHGVLRDTDPDNLREIVKLVHDRTRSRK